ncbi:Helix-turn-helix [Paractinoplanes atraurantiacus]|uniref:Helix-turn-helix n=2 Tax=Paractinoplanes atraurantiacus TaxID=1036182 RepID=A0A285F5I6_9ACTN|nr:Helix-turn-helix [Actinoplanes atraurantiacus]
MTLRDLADASGVSARAISDMERGHSTAPQQRTLDALAAALTLSPFDRAALTEAAAAAKSGLSRTAYAPPRDVPDFTGRAAELALLSTSRRVVIHGQPGVGKTALAVHAAAAVPQAHFLDCRAGDLRARLQKIPAAALVILDNATAAPVPLPPATAVWITSRRRLPVDGATHLHLKPLPPPESAALLTAITGTPDPAATEVAAYCGHVPLALRIAGNRIAGRPGWTMTHLAARLADEPRRLATLTAGDLSVEATLAQAFAALSAPARALCQAIAKLPDFTPGIAATVTGLPESEANDVIAELIDHDLIHPAGEAESYRLHPLPRMNILFGVR